MLVCPSNRDRRRGLLLAGLAAEGPRARTACCRRSESADRFTLLLLQTCSVALGLWWRWRPAMPDPGRARRRPCVALSYDPKVAAAGRCICDAPPGSCQLVTPKDLRMSWEQQLDAAVHYQTKSLNCEPVPPSRKAS